MDTPDKIVIGSGTAGHLAFLSGLVEVQPQIEAVTSLVILCVMVAWLFKIVSDTQLSRQSNRRKRRKHDT